MLPQLVCLVEGKGEQIAAPRLVYRIAALTAPGLAFQTPVIRASRDKLIQSSELEQWVQRTGRKVGGQGALLILLDGDDDLPCQLGPALLGRASQARPDLPCAVVLARREYEAWFLAAAESLRGQRGLPDDLQPPPNPEDVRGAKEWLRRHWPQNRKYNETTDQPGFTQEFDLDLARSRSPSFDKCYREIERLLRLFVPAEPPDTATPGPSDQPG